MQDTHIAPGIASPLGWLFPPCQHALQYTLLEALRAYAFSPDTVTDSIFFTPLYLVVLVEQLAPDLPKPAVGQVNISLFASSKKI